MEQHLKQYILSLNIGIIHEVWDSITSREQVGWLLKSPSVIRKTTSMDNLTEFIKNNHLGYVLHEETDCTNQLFMYKM